MSAPTVQPLFAKTILARTITAYYIRPQPYGIADEDQFDPRLLYTAGEQGAWYDPSDFSTLFQDAAGTTPVTALGQPVGRILDKSGRGNHATQTTAASRPTVQARVNLLTQTESFVESGKYFPANVTVSTSAGTAPDGTNTAIKLQASDTATTTLYYEAALGQTNYRHVFYIKKGVLSGSFGNSLIFRNTTTATNVAVASINYTTGVVTNTVGTAFSSEDAGGGWWKITGNVSSGFSASDTVRLYYGWSSASATAGDHIFVWHPDCRNPSISQGLPDYQRVNTATDYADVGAARYNLFDKTDDHFTAAAGGAGTTGFLFACGVVVPAAGTARTIFSDLGTNAGYKLGIDAANKVVFSGGTGAAFTTLTSAGALTAGTKYVLLAWHDGTNLNLSINNVAETPVAQGTVTAGTAGFTIGKDNGAASGYWGDRIYNMVYRKNDTSTASQRSSVYSFIRSKMGAM